MSEPTTHESLRFSRRGVLASTGAATLATGLTIGSAETAEAHRPKRKKRQRGPQLDGRVLFREDFDDIHGPTGFTHEAPNGWTTSAHGFRTGEGRWSGWTFTNVRDWTWAVGTDERHWFTGGFGTFAVLESEHHRLADDSTDTLNATLTTPAIPVRGHGRLELCFDHHYKQGRAGQSAAVTVSFDGAPARDLLVLDADRSSSHEALTVEVPRRARTVRFGFDYRNGHNDKWWALDNVMVRVPLPTLAADAKPLVTIDVVSDIHVSDSSTRYDRVIDQLNAMAPAAGALVINGDGVELGKQEHYDRLAQALRERPHRSGEVLYSVGNHEMLGKEGSQVYLDRYLAVAGQSKPYFEKVVAGQPLIVTGLEHFSDPDRKGREPYNNFSAEQLRWLDRRLAHWAQRGQVVMLFNHFPLPYTVSQTHSSWEQNNYEDIDAFNAVVGKYRNIVMFTGHTHADLTLNDWWGRYRVADDANPAGFPVVNTGAVLNGYLPDGDLDQSVMDGDHSTGVRVHRFDDRYRIEAFDFVAGKVTKTLELPIER